MGFSVRAVLLPLVHVSIQCPRWLLVWTVFKPPPYPNLPALCLLSKLHITCPTVSLYHLCCCYTSSASLFQHAHNLALCGVSCQIAVCCVQYSHLFMSHWPAHRLLHPAASVCSRQSKLHFPCSGRECYKIYSQCADSRTRLENLGRKAQDVRLRWQAAW